MLFCDVSITFLRLFRVTMCVLPTGNVCSSPIFEPVGFGVGVVIEILHPPCEICEKDENLDMAKLYVIRKVSTRRTQNRCPNENRTTAGRVMLPWRLSFKGVSKSASALAHTASLNMKCKPFSDIGVSVWGVSLKGVSQGKGSGVSLGSYCEFNYEV